MKSREDIITNMCYTFRHDFGLTKNPDQGLLEAGMTPQEQKVLWDQMAQIFDNDIAPQLNGYNQLVNGDSVVLPKNRDHAESMVRVGIFYLENNK